MIDCKEAAKLIDKNDFEKLDFSQKLNLRMHNAMCGKCRGYKRFSHVLKSLFGKLNTHKECLSSEEKEEIKNKLSN